ncbi:recombinase family protein [Pseudonocardia cypriaca]|uniref:recombinase family protein n=1 Tax=Pseudonocardia cypriaca TaxID=882449 RepID=UPI001151CC45|nr:recombinase family protein [Pseudonocardia cypriaca]
MLLIAYVRVSTERQAERFGPAAQRAAIREWAKATGARIARFVEDATSGALSEREGLGEVLAEIRAGTVAGVVVARLDRFSRDMLVQEHLMSDVWGLGGEVYSTAPDENNLRDDPDDPSRKLIRRMLGAVVEYDREMTLLRLRNGRRAKAKAGGFAYGSPPFGYTAVNGKLRRSKDEQATLRQMLALAADGASTRAIADQLNAAGRPAKRGGPWSSAAVARVLRTNTRKAS